MERLLDRSATSLDEGNKILGESSKKVSLIIKFVKPRAVTCIIVHGILNHSTFVVGYCAMSVI